MQEVDQDQLVTTVTNSLFRIDQDPYEHENLADRYPDKVAELSGRIQQWRALHPINGVRSTIAPPPGWRPPRDWADYPRPLVDLQPHGTAGVAPTESSLRTLDYMHGLRGRLLYDCPPPGADLQKILNAEKPCPLADPVDLRPQQQRP